MTMIQAKKHLTQMSMCRQWKRSWSVSWWMKANTFLSIKLSWKPHRKHTFVQSSDLEEHGHLFFPSPEGKQWRRKKPLWPSWYRKVKDCENLVISFFCSRKVFWKAAGKLRGYKRRILTAWGECLGEGSESQVFFLGNSSSLHPAGWKEWIQETGKYRWQSKNSWMN